MSIHDPNYYDWTTFMRKTHLSNREIQEFRDMDSAAIGAVFMRVGVAKGAQLFCALKESFNIADAVAKAAWGYVKAIENGDEYNAKEEFESCKRALNDYSPDNWRPHRSVIQFAAEYFEKMYNEVGTKATLAEAHEVIFEYGSRLQELLAKEGGPLQRPDAGYVASGMARVVKDTFPCIENEGTNHLEQAETMLAVCKKPTPKGKRVQAPPTCVDCIRISGLFSS
jgi:hypothetical protein